MLKSIFHFWADSQKPVCSVALLSFEPYALALEVEWWLSKMRQNPALGRSGLHLGSGIEGVLPRKASYSDWVRELGPREIDAVRCDTVTARLDSSVSLS